MTKSTQNTKVIWLDVDGVLLDYTRPFLRFAGLEYKVQYDTLFDYDLTKLFDTPEECHNKMLLFALSKQFAGLPSIANPTLLAALKNVGYELRVVTKLPAPNSAKLSRIHNLTSYFGPVFSEIIFTGASDCKLEYIMSRRKLEPKAEYIVIEDNPDFLLKADNINTLLSPNSVEVIGISHPYNRDAQVHLQLIGMEEHFDVVANQLITRTL